MHVGFALLVAVMAGGCGPRVVHDASEYRLTAPDLEVPYRATRSRQIQLLNDWAPSRPRLAEVEAALARSELQFRTSEQLYAHGRLFLEQDISDSECLERTSISVGRPEKDKFISEVTLRVHPIVWSDLERFPQFHDRDTSAAGVALSASEALFVTEADVTIQTLSYRCGSSDAYERSASAFVVPFDPAHCKNTKVVAEDICRATRSTLTEQRFCITGLADQFRCP